MTNEMNHQIGGAINAYAQGQLHTYRPEGRWLYWGTKGSEEEAASAVEDLSAATVDWEYRYVVSGPGMWRVETRRKL